MNNSTYVQSQTGWTFLRGHDDRTHVYLFTLPITGLGAPLLLQANGFAEFVSSNVFSY